jgi:hypothetical protein
MWCCLGLLFFSSLVFAESTPFKIAINNAVPYEGHLLSFFIGGTAETPPQGSKVIPPVLSIPPGYAVPSNTEFTENYAGVGDSVYFYVFYDQKQNPTGISCTFVIHSDHSALGTFCSGIKVDAVTISEGGNVGVVFNLKSLSDPSKKA